METLNGTDSWYVSERCVQAHCCLARSHILEGESDLYYGDDYIGSLSCIKRLVQAEHDVPIPVECGHDRSSCVADYEPLLFPSLRKRVLAEGVREPLVMVAVVEEQQRGWW